MGKKTQNPRYNILSCRVSDELRECVQHALAGQAVQDFLHRAITDKLINDRQERIDTLIREHRR